jgi:hypothetical protein
MATAAEADDMWAGCGRKALFALVGFGLSVLTSLVLLGGVAFSRSLAAGSESVLVVLWLLGGGGLVVQGAFGLLLHRRRRVPRRRPDTRVTAARDSVRRGAE